MKSPVPQAHVLALNFQTTWVAVVALVLEVAALAWYLPAIRRSSARGRPWPALKTFSFVLAVLATAYTVEGGLAHYARSNFTANTVRCMVLFDAVPPLLAFSAPVTLALRSSSAGATDRLLDALQSRWAHALAHPVIGVVFGQVVLYLYFLTPLYSFSERHSGLGGLMEVLFVLAGCVYWWPVVGGDVLPRKYNYPSRFAMLFASVPLTIALGVAVSSLAKPLYPAFNTLADTHTGGEVFWEISQVFIVLVLALLFVSMASEEERKAKQVDRQLDATVNPPATGASPTP